MKLLLKQIRLPLAEFPLELNVEIEGQVIGLFGISGSGKTSLLDLIAGLRQPHSATIALDKTVLTDTTCGCSVSPHRRNIGYVPQDGALFPHFSVRHNVLYGAQGKSPLGFSLKHVTEVLGIHSLMERSIQDLSGGEKQRVALARALLSHPQLLLLDEPLASLDGALKEKSLSLLQAVRSEFSVPMIYVSHSAEEVFSLSDSVIVLERGKVIRHGKTQEIFKKTNVESVSFKQ